MKDVEGLCWRLCGRWALLRDRSLLFEINTVQELWTWARGLGKGGSQPSPRRRSERAFRLPVASARSCSRCCCESRSRSSLALWLRAAAPRILLTTSILESFSSSSSESALGATSLLSKGEDEGLDMVRWRLRPSFLLCEK